MLRARLAMTHNTSLFTIPCAGPMLCLVQEIHDTIMREAIGRHGGLEVNTEGDR